MRLLIFVLLALISLQPAHAGGGEKAATETPGLYIELAPLIVTIPAAKGGRNHLLTLELTLEMADSDAASKTKEVLPRLQDVFVRGLYALAGHGRLLVDGLPDVEGIRAALLAYGRQVEGAEKISSVLVRNLNFRRL